MFFFFSSRRRHTRWTGDWSSDVCSSDLVKLGDNALAIGDIFGGNAFQVCLFLVADLVAGSPVLPTAGRLNGWLASLGVGLRSEERRVGKECRSRWVA